MNCRHLLDALSDYLDDQAAAAVKADLEAHLAECKSCTVIVETSRRTLKIVTDVGSFEIPDELSERLLKKTMAGLASARAAGDPESGEPESGS
jgi:predicted anti-sigma-YlaC factor YlaD